jgi:hypothetical protein
MKMRLHRKRNPEVEAFRQLHVRGWIPTGVKDERPTVAERHQVGGVSEALVDKGHDLRPVDLGSKPAHEVTGLRPPIRI